MRQPIRHVLITGGREAGGLTSFSQGLARGFQELGLNAEVVAPHDLGTRWRDLRDAGILKVLSTTGAFAAPFARRAVCVAHGFPRPDAQGWLKTLAIVGSLKAANRSGDDCKLVAVSEYTAAHLRAVYRLRVDGVIRNPVDEWFMQPFAEVKERRQITFAGRLIPVKNVHRLLPAVRRLLEEEPDLHFCVAGDGPQRALLERAAEGETRIRFTGNLGRDALREQLRQTSVFVSGCETEALGIAYLEALSQGCAVAMPACGGGLEIAPELIGTQIQLFPLSFDEERVLAALKASLAYSGRPLTMDGFKPAEVAAAYLRVTEN
jgi:glycosyltransferase involved in cell wall biosynthesis